jgi:hypothetical protein
MRNSEIDSSSFGSQLVSSLALSEQVMNQLVAALLLTAFGVFISANLLLLEPLTLLCSAQVTVACLGILLLFYMLSRQTGSVLWGITLTCGTAWLVVFSRQPWLTFALRGLAAVALLYALRFLRVARRDLPVLLGMALAASIAIAGMEAYTSFDMLPRLHAGAVHQDTLYHASIAAMIKNYGVVSTGLHGLVETPYHTFSHVLMACLSLLSGVSVIEVYGVANPVLLAPLLIFSVTACCAMLDRAQRLSLPFAWGAVVLLLALVPVLFGRWMALQRPYFISESYVLALGLFTLGLTLLYKQQLSWGDLLLTLLLSAMISNAKASVGLIFAGLWVTRLLFVRGQSSKHEAVAAIVAVAAAGWVVFGVTQTVAGTAFSVELFPLIRTFSLWGSHLDAVLAGQVRSLATVILAGLALIGFFAVHFLLAWAVIVLTVRSSKVGLIGLLHAPLSVYSLAALLAGACVASTFNAGGGAAFYFSNVAFFVALPGAAALLSGWMQQYIAPQRFFLYLLVLICLLEWHGFAKNSLRYHQQYAAGQENTLISSLIKLRQASPTPVVQRAFPQTLANNPVQLCTAQPFVFPAVSERPWVGVLKETECLYTYYGYAQYGITKEQPQINLEPVLLPGMTISTP